MSELLPCPFCNSELIFPIDKTPWGEIFFCQGCSTRFVTKFETFQQRPIEDALRARIAELEHQLSRQYEK